MDRSDGSFDQIDFSEYVQTDDDLVNSLDNLFWRVYMPNTDWNWSTIWDQMEVK